jgi:4-amino-4-deoxy-L-arabinose transferase-like glycosyltransferase
VDAILAENKQRATVTAGPALLVIALCLTQILFWTAVPAITYKALPLDVVEIYSWGPHWLIGSYKHPALTSWLLEMTRTMTGTTGWPAYLLSQIWVALTFAIIFLLGKDAMGSERAAIATLLMPWIYYFTWHTPEFNHDIIQLPLWAAIAWTAWRAVRSQRMIWWLCLGAISALALYGKLASGFMLIATAAWLLIDTKARSSLRTAGPWAAFTLFALLIVPLLTWMTSAEATPLQFAMKRGDLNSKSVLAWVGIQVGIACGVLIPLAIGQFTRGEPLAPSLVQLPPAIEARWKFFVTMIALGPMALAIAGFVTLGTGAKLMWGVPMLTFAGLFAATWLPDRRASISLTRLAALSCALTAALALIHGGTMLRYPNDSEKLKRAQWPQAEINQKMRSLYAVEVGHPLSIVAGPIDNWLAGLIAVSKSDVLDIYTSADTALSPWVTPDRLKAEGALVVWKYPECGVPDELVPLALGRMPRIETFRTSNAAAHRPLRIGYVIYQDSGQDSGASGTAKSPAMPALTLLLLN